MANQGNSGEAIMAFMLGGIIGAALGFLLAPAPGEETRNKLAEWAKTEKEKSAKYWGETKGVISHKGEQVKRAVDAGKKAYQEANVS